VHDGERPADSEVIVHRGDEGGRERGSREDAASELALDALVRAQLDARQVARQERDFERADEIRDTLTAVGIEITDTPSGAQWSLARPARGDAGAPTHTTDVTTAAPGAEKAQG